MFEQLKPLIESGIITEETSTAITEAWEARLDEAKDQVRAELREEYAQKHEHDKKQMANALDKMVSESLSHEIKEFQRERQIMTEDRVKAKRNLSETANKFDSFLVTKLAEEIGELRKDRETNKANQQKLEEFIVHALSKEIKEFAQDKQAVTEARVKLVTEGKKRLAELEQKFVTESAQRLKSTINKHLKSEITQLKEDITAAKQNSFGRKLFEAYMAEFSTSYVSQNAMARKIDKQLKATQKQLEESIAQNKKTKAIVESKEREVRMIKESNLRERTMSELLGTLNDDKSKIMKELLESIQTPRLKDAFDKYLPAVLNGNQTRRKMISESKIETGDKTANLRTTDDDNVFDIKRLAGLK